MKSLHRPFGICLAAAACFLAGCNVGPEYHRTPVGTPAAYKELTPKDYPNIDGWKKAQPKDDSLRGKWWVIFGDPQLNALEEKVNISNQTIASAAASFMAARAIVKEARSQLFPTVTTGPGITKGRSSSNLGNSAVASAVSGSGSSAVAAKGGTYTTYAFPFDATWQPDLFGRVRNTVKAAAYSAQASAADLENVRLSVQAELANDYFQLRGQDALKQLLDATVDAYKKSLELTRALYETGIDSEESVAQAETQLASADAEDTAVGIQRAQLEHAMAMLT